ncbi:hypothetical protein GCM10022403_006520 [Streptomyces coacervatus]|uniref:histidine kinase n=1 Tax=Streptomyces coacervatus TaxID=647381 RepID=A0ABP7GSP3_9ACTN
MEHATAQLADGRLTDPPDTRLGPPELRRLAASFTHTAARLQYLLRAQEAIGSEASHQLKTPLTARRLRLENPAQHPATIQTLTTRTPRITRDDRQQRLDPRPQLVVDLPGPGSGLPRLDWLAPPSAGINEN